MLHAAKLQRRRGGVAAADNDRACAEEPLPEGELHAHVTDPVELDLLHRNVQKAFDEKQTILRQLVFRKG